MFYKCLSNDFNTRVLYCPEYSPESSGQATEGMRLLEITWLAAQTSIVMNLTKLNGK